MPRRPAKGSGLVVPAGDRTPATCFAPPRPLDRAAAAAATAIEPLEGRLLLSTTYYVATTGNDANTGTALGAPFRTIQRAANLAKPGDTVLVRGGTYRETVKPARSGTANARITFKPFRDSEPVTVSGADVVSGWGNYKDRVYKATQSWDLGLGENQVFVDGQMMIEARWPNTTLDLSHPVKATADRVTAGKGSATLYDASLTQANGAWNGATIHIVPGQGWVAQTGKVTSSSKGKLTYTYQSMGADAVPEGDDPYYLTGKFQALDAPAEWFRDPGTKQLYLWTPDGSSPATHTVEAKRRDYAFDLNGRSYIDVQGFSLFAAGVASSASSGNLRLTGLDAEYVSHYTQLASGWSRDHESGIQLEGNNNLLADSVIAFSAGHGVVLAGKNSRAENNVIHDVAYAGADEAGIRTEGEGHVLIHNTIYNAGRDGIKISNTTRVKVLSNVVRDVMLQTTDGGAVYTYGADGNGSEIAYNRISGVHTGGFGGVGVFLDNSSSEYVVHHNVVYGVDHALKMNPPSRNNLVYNNTLAGDDTSVDSNRGRDLGGSAFVNNIFTNDAEISSASVRRNNLSAGSDVGFVNPAAGDFTLRPGSAAIDRGATLGTYTAGYAGAAPDLGAYEYGRAPFAAGADLDVPTRPTPTPPPPTPDDPAPTTPPPPPPAVKGRRNARNRIEAEGFDAQQGIRKANHSIGYAENGDWLRFDAVDFGAGGVQTFQARVALDKAYAGGRIEVRLGSPTGTLAATLTTKGTGGWDSYQTQTAAARGLSGVRDVYVVFRSSRTGGIANMDWVTFA